MARTSTYLNFNGNTEEAFHHYRSVFGTDFTGPITRMGDVPPQPGHPVLNERQKQLVMNVQLPITGGHLLMGADADESMGFPVKVGNNFYIAIDPDSRAEAERLFNALADGGAVQWPLSEAFWGDYFGSLVDKFGVQWMVNCTSKS